MDIAALIAWVATAVGGFILLVRWISRGGLRQQQSRTTRFRAPVVFGHFVLAVAGLVVWLIYLAADRAALAWTSFVIFVAGAILGFTMFARWIPVYRTAVPAGADEESTPAERHLPVAVVVAHGVGAAMTLILVLLAALG
ncbi:hypothetical protein [Streptomyces sp. NPDC002671]